MNMVLIGVARYHVTYLDYFHHIVPYVDPFLLCDFNYHTHSGAQSLNVSFFSVNF
jgi:hypothetical protein